MKKLLIKTFFILSFFVPVNAQEKCDGILAKLKAECNVVGKSMDKMREFSKENKTIDQTFKNIKEKFKK